MIYENLYRITPGKRRFLVKKETKWVDARKVVGPRQPEELDLSPALTVVPNEVRRPGQFLPIFDHSWRVFFSNRQRSDSSKFGLPTHTQGKSGNPSCAGTCCQRCTGSRGIGAAVHTRPGIEISHGTMWPRAAQIFTKIEWGQHANLAAGKRNNEPPLCHANLAAGQP